MNNLQEDGSIKVPFILLMISAFIMIIISLIGVVWGFSALGKYYAVWSNGMEGKAELAKADFNRQIQVREAIAKRDAAGMLAQAEIERARGVAQANKIIGDSLRGNEMYLRYLWVDGLQHTNNQIIYIPTETNLPILEATRNKYNKEDHNNDK